MWKNLLTGREETIKICDIFQVITLYYLFILIFFFLKNRSLSRRLNFSKYRSKAIEEYKKRTDEAKKMAAALSFPYVSAT